MMLRLIACFLTIIIFLACGEGDKKELKVKSKKEYQELMIESHKAYLEKESEKLDEYIESSNLEFTRSESGLRYSIISTSMSHDSLKKGDIAIVNYTLTFLNGDTAYQSIEGEPQEFIVAFDDVEAGLHEGIQKLAIGDKAVFILPAHLAHGISGDQAAIPAQSPVVYHIELIGKR